MRYGTEFVAIGQTAWTCK